MDELITYLHQAEKLGISEFRLVNQSQSSEGIHLYLHPLGRDGVSADLLISMDVEDDDDALTCTASGDWDRYAK